MFFNKEKPNYGLDAPLVVKFFLLLAVFYGAVAGLIYRLIYESYPYLGLVLIFGTAITAIFFVFAALLMIRSSYWGKISLAHRVAKNLSLKGDEVILDMGCGRGLFMNTLAKSLTTGKTVGVDIWDPKDQSGNSKEAAWQNAKLEGVQERVEIITSDMRDLPFEDNQFNIVISCLALHNITQKQEREKAVIQACRVLKPGGQLIIIDLKYCREYAEFLLGQGWKEIDLTKRTTLIMPPARILKATKPI